MSTTSTAIPALLTEEEVMLIAKHRVSQMPITTGELANSTYRERHTKKLNDMELEMLKLMRGVFYHAFLIGQAQGMGEELIIE